MTDPPNKLGSPRAGGVPNLFGQAPQQVGESQSLFPGEQDLKKREFHPPHIYQDNSCYFITARTVHGRNLLDSDAKRRLMRDILRKAIEQHDIRLYAWVILANHYHLLLRTGDTPIFKFIKRLHGQSAVELNKMDDAPKRKVWYQYWDRFPRNEHEFWAYFNYIHINPIKHNCVQISDGVLVIKGGHIQIDTDRVLDVHQCLVHYVYSSYPYYLREYGEAFLTDVWLSHPISDYLSQDNL
jgi:putative transposase